MSLSRRSTVDRPVAALHRRAAVGRLVRPHHRGDAEAPLARSAARRRVDRLQAGNGVRHPSSSATRKPVTPCSTISGAEPSGKAITGVPQASDSSITRPNGSGQRIGISNAARAPEEVALAHSVGLADVLDAVPAELRLHVLGEVRILTRLHRPGQDERDGRPAAQPRSRGGRPSPVFMRPIQSRNPSFRERNGHSSTSIGLCTTPALAHGGGRRVELRLRDGDDVRLAPVIRIKAGGILGEGSVEGVHERRGEAVGHGERGMAAVVVDDVERAPAPRRRVDRARTRGPTWSTS